jgi:hypothetical protein
MANRDSKSVEQQLGLEGRIEENKGNYCLWVRDRANYNNRLFRKFEDLAEANRIVDEVEKLGNFTFVLKNGTAGEVLRRSEDEF